jgi:TatD DNase family protein
MIDFHCHLDLYPNPEAVVRECVSRGVYVLSVTTTPSAWRGTSALARGASRIRTALGLHPQIVHERKGELPLFEQLLPEVRYVGETGLDGSPEYKQSWDDQLRAFTQILDLCEKAGGRVLTIHSRRAARQVLDRLTEYPRAGTPILHWFSGSPSELVRAVDLGCWFSVGPAMLAGQKGRALASRMPRERVLTETDGPFAQLEGRAAMPWDAEQATKLLAEVWGIPMQEAAKQVSDNLRRLVDS